MFKKGRLSWVYKQVACTLCGKPTRFTKEIDGKRIPLCDDCIWRDDKYLFPNGTQELEIDYNEAPSIKPWWKKLFNSRS